MLYLLLQKLLILYFRLAYNHEVKGLHHVLGCKQGCIIAANHTSFLDPPLIGASIPYPVHFLAKSELFHNPLMRLLITQLNAIPLTQRIDHKAFKKLTASSREGITVVIFPEGTRTPEGTLEPFSPGVALLAKSLNIPVVPAYIHGAFDIWPTSRFFPHLRGKTTIAFGPPLNLHDFRAEKKHEQYRLFVEAIEKEVSSLSKDRFNNN